MNMSKRLHGVDSPPKFRDWVIDELQTEDMEIESWTRGAYGRRVEKTDGLADSLDEGADALSPGLTDLAGSGSRKDVFGWSQYSRGEQGRKSGFGLGSRSPTIGGFDAEAETPLSTEPSVLNRGPSGGIAIDPSNMPAIRGGFGAASIPSINSGREGKRGEDGFLDGNGVERGRIATGKATEGEDNPVDAFTLDKLAGDLLPKATDSSQGEADGDKDEGRDDKEQNTVTSTSGQGKDDGKQGRTKKPTPQKNQPNNKTWKRSHLIPNTSRLKVGADSELPISGMQANIEIDGFRARVLLDIYFHNDRDRNLEGTFQIRLPVGASLYFFAFGETSYSYRGKDRPPVQQAFFNVNDRRRFGNSPQEIMTARSNTWRSPKEARMVPREKAAFAYRSTVRRRVDPALVEWAGAGMFNAKIFPITPKKLHRIVIGYDVNLQQVGDELVYRLDVPQELPQLSVDLNVSALAGMNAEVTPKVKPFTSGGRAYYRYDNPQESSLVMRFRKPGVVLLSDKTDETGPYFATRFRAELPQEPATGGSPIGVFLVDTSASSHPDRMNTHLKLMKATLNGNRQQMKQFAVLFFNIEQHWWQKKLVKNTKQNVTELIAYANTMALEGATDLKSALAEAADPAWLSLKGKMRYDLFLLSDGAATWGDRSLFNMAQQLKAGSVGSLFAYQTGMTGTDVRALQYLTREIGGAVITVASEDEIDQAAQSHRFQPWQLAGVDVAGTSDLLLAGRPKTIYPGQQLLLVGRGTPADGAKISLKLRRGDELKTVLVAIDRTIDSDLASRAFGQVATGALENVLPISEDVATAYARHFRITGQSCSLLMLETEEDYLRFNIKPEDDAFVVSSTAASSTIEKAFEKAARLLSDPKAMFLRWLARLEKMPGAEFNASAAMKIAVDNLPASAFDISIKPLVCQDRTWQGVSDKLRNQLASGKLHYDSVILEASRRTDSGAHADALRGISSLVEMNPGNLSLARDVAYSALEWDQPGQAYHLLHRVAKARPYEPQMYLAMAQSLAQLGNHELAVLYYEVALAGKWDGRFQEFAYITRVDYLHLLRKLDAQQYSGPLKAFVDARRERLAKQVNINQGDLVVSIMWNTDGTDVDLHINEPSGEVCYYSNRKTKSGGRMTADVTQGFGPELYILRNAPRGKYGISVKYFASDANRAGTRTRVYATIYEGWGTKNERVVRKAVLLKTGKEMHEVLSVGIEK